MNKRIKFFLLTFLLLLVGWLGFDMIRLGLDQQLWGYRPLPFFLGLWAFIIVVLEKWYFKTKEQQKWTLWSSLSGVLLSIGFPGFLPAPFFLFAGFVPLFFVEQEISKSSERKTRNVIRYGYNTFVIWNIITTFWVANSSLAAGAFAIFVNALLMCVPFLLFHLTKRWVPKVAYFSFLVYWMTFEYIHLNWDLTWPWLTLGNGFAAFPSWVQWYEYTGVFGGSLWILLMNVLIFKKMAAADKPFFQLNATSLQIGSALLVPIVFSLIRYFNYNPEGRSVEVVLVQPNFEPHYEKFNVTEEVHLAKYMELSRSAVSPQTEYLVYPESSFGYVETHQFKSYPAIVELERFMSGFPRLKIVTGMNAYTRFLEGEPHTSHTRLMVNSVGDSSYLEVSNIALQLSPEQDSIQWYKKSKLVPGPEAFPYQEILYVFKPIVDKLGGTIEGIGEQKERVAFSSSSGKVAPVICYESIFGEFFTGYIKKGAQAAFIVTNDGWWDNTQGHRQHLYYASLRAIETRRDIARAAYTGISAFIDQKGKIGQRTNYDEAAVLKGNVRLNNRITFYVKWGDMIARLSLFSSLLLLLNLIVKFWQSKLSNVN